MTIVTFFIFLFFFNTFTSTKQELFKDEKNKIIIASGLGAALPIFLKTLTKNKITSKFFILSPTLGALAGGLFFVKMIEDDKRYFKEIKKTYFSIKDFIKENNNFYSADRYKFISRWENTLKEDYYNLKFSIERIIQSDQHNEKSLERLFLKINTEIFEKIIITARYNLSFNEKVKEILDSIKNKKIIKEKLEHIKDVLEKQYQEIKDKNTEEENIRSALTKIEENIEKIKSTNNFQDLGNEYEKKADYLFNLKRIAEIFYEATENLNRQIAESYERAGENYSRALSYETLIDGEKIALINKGSSMYKYSADALCDYDKKKAAELYALAADLDIKEAKMMNRQHEVRRRLEWAWYNYHRASQVIISEPALNFFYLKERANIANVISLINKLDETCPKITRFRINSILEGIRNYKGRIIDE